MHPWDTVRTGELGDFTYFAGGRMNVADNCVDRWAEDPATAQKTAVIWEGEPGDVRTVSYAELASEVSRLAGALVELGVTKGDVVAIYMPNAIEAFTAVHACNRIGAIYTILFSGFGPDAVRSRLEASRAKLVIVLDASYRRTKLIPLLDTLRTARGQVATVQHTIVVDRTGRGVPLQDGEISYTDALELAPEGTPAVPLEANDPAFLIFTSGTEARPKGVVHSVAGFLLGTWANVLLAGRPGGRRRVLGRGRRRLADVPDPGRGGRAGQRHDRGLLRRGHGQPHQRQVLRDLREAPRDQGAGGADAAAHAAQVRRRPGRGSPAAGAEAGHRPG